MLFFLLSFLFRFILWPLGGVGGPDQPLGGEPLFWTDEKQGCKFTSLYFAGSSGFWDTLFIKLLFSYDFVNLSWT